MSLQSRGKPCEINIVQFTCTKNKHSKTGFMKNIGRCSRKFGENEMAHLQCSKCHGITHYKMPLIPSLTEIQSTDDDLTLSEILKCCNVPYGTYENY